MKINWKLRFQNKLTLAAIIAGVVALVYQIFSVVGFVPKVSDNEVLTVCNMVLEVLVLMGVVIDPTTAGAGDSAQAIGYTEPKR